MSIRRACKAMSIATTESTRLLRLPRSHTVRKTEVVGNPRRMITSDSESSALLTFTPARERIDKSRAMVTSIGSEGASSRPCSHPAVGPENANLAGMRSCTARSFSRTSCCNPAQAYWPRLSRVHRLVWSVFHSTPSLRAWSTVNGPCRSSLGTDWLTAK